MCSGNTIGNRDVSGLSNMMYFILFIHQQLRVFFHKGKEIFISSITESIDPCLPFDAADFPHNSILFLLYTSIRIIQQPFTLLVCVSTFPVCLFIIWIWHTNYFRTYRVAIVQCWLVARMEHRKNWLSTGFVIDMEFLHNAVQKLVVFKSLVDSRSVPVTSITKS